MKKLIIFFWAICLSMKSSINIMVHSLLILFSFLFASYTRAQNSNTAGVNLLQKIYNTSSLEWKLYGYSPENWRRSQINTNPEYNAETRGIPATVPGSVQMALKNAGIIKDWNIGLNHQENEWIENRSWIYTTSIPNDWIKKDKIINLVCKGLDDNGLVLINGKEVGQFNNTFIPHVFDISSFLNAKDNSLAIVFGLPPRYLGTPCWTSKITDWKPRFYYVWDWMPRIVQVGIWDEILIEVTDNDQVAIEDLKVSTSSDRYEDLGVLNITGIMSNAAKKGKLRVQLENENGKIILDETIPCTQIRDGKTWTNLKIERWWPNGLGEQNLYSLGCTLFDEAGNKRQEIKRKVGFKNISWEHNPGAPVESDHWICVVNNKPVFLQGVNWTPIRPNFADLIESDYRKLIGLYKKLGANIFRTWGGACIEKEYFYDLCDEMGIMVWQEFPLSSSGYDNYPPETPKEIQTMAIIARSYIKRLRHHPSILMWCGGNELYEFGDKAIVPDSHPMIRCMKDVVNSEDPGRRFVTASPSGINIWGGLDNFGKGVNWDTHGPWTLPFTENDKTMTAVQNYWNLDDALMHSEVGVPGAASAEIIIKYKGNFDVLPANQDNPLWNRFSWWIDWNEYVNEHKGNPIHNLENYVSWSQDRQAKGLSIALEACKKRFPNCGGFIIWMGHDSFPCTANTSIIDFDGNPKPAAIAVSKIWKTNYEGN